MSLTRRTEIRHISPADLGKLAQLLNQTFAWKKLMQTVPSDMTHPEHLNEGKQKYNFNDMKLVENASFKVNKAPAQIFLDEWATTGKIRPTLSHLLQLLIKSELFRAADFVAVDLLKEEPPQRPSKGPAAKIDIALLDDDEADDVHERILEMNYPNSSEIINLNNGHIPSKEIHNKQLFDRVLIADAPISEEDLIRLSAAKSTSNNVQVQENNHISIQSHEPTMGLNRPKQRSEDTVNQVSLPSSSINSPNTSSVRTDSTPIPPESNYEMDGSTDYITSTLSSSTSFSPQMSLLMGNYSHENVQQVQNPLENSSSDNIYPNVSLLNVPIDGANKSNLHELEDDVEFPNLSVLNLPKRIDTPPQELDLPVIIPQLSGLFRVSEDSSNNVVPQK